MLRKRVIETSRLLDMRKDGERSPLTERLTRGDVLRRAAQLKVELEYDRAVIEGDTDRQRALEPLVKR
jgi:hypothetical protein